MKTTVEWLEHMLLIILNKEEFKKITYAVEQAKEMEKQQIIDAQENGQSIYSDVIRCDKSIQYYNEIFKK